MYKAIICDVGGVLITPSEKVTPYILSQMFNIPLDVALRVFIRALPELRKGTIKIYQLAEQINLQFPPKSKIADFEQTYLGYYEKQALINMEMMQLLEKISQKCLLVAFSNMVDLHVRLNSQRGLFRNFHKMYISSATGYVKPDKTAFIHLLKDINLVAGECLCIDDQKDVVDTAQSLGMTGYLFDTADKLSGFLEKNGVL
jgi:glucose-1-phosphatase